MSPLTIRLAEYSREGGQEQKRGYNARMVVPPPGSPEARKGILVIHLDLLGPTRHLNRHLRHLLNIIQSTYYTTPGTIRSTLEYAIQEAHRALLDINKTIEDEKDHYLCNASCLVLHEDDVYLAQVGAMTACVRLPDKLRWISPLMDESDTPYPLGMERPIRTYITHIPAVQPGTTFILLDSGWLNQIEVESFRRALQMQDLDAMLRELARDVDSPHLSALALRVEEEEETARGEREEREGEGESFTQKLAEHVRTVTERLLPEEEDVEEMEEEFTMPEPPPVRTPRAWPFRRRPVSLPSLPWKRLLWGLVVLIPLLALLIAAGVWWHHGRQQEQLYQSALTQAAAALQKASATDDQELARQYIHQAELAIRQAEEIHPGTEEIERLKESLRNSRLRVERIIPLYVMWPLAELPSGDWTRVIVHEQDIFLLDREGDRVVRYTLDDTGKHLQKKDPQPLLQRGDVVGDRPVGDVVDMSWLPAGLATRVSGIVVLDGAGALYTYDSRQGTQPLPFARPENWQTPIRIATYGDRLYVLDPGANAIFRFNPTDKGYTQPPENYFSSPVQLDAAIDLAIDGHVYLLFADGRVLRYFGGEQTPFVVDTTLSLPTAIVTDEMIQHLYIADAGNQRILILGKEGEQEGKLLAQLVPGEGFDVDFSQVRSIFVTENEDDIYILTNAGLWKAPIPVSHQTP